MPTYKVHSNLVHSGTDYIPGQTVKMSEQNAAPLLDLRVISPAEEVPPVQTPAAPEAPAAPQGDAPVAPPAPNDPEANTGSEGTTSQALGGQNTVNGSDKPQA